MKKIFLFLSLFSLNSYAVIFQIKNICSDSLYFQQEIQILHDTTVGHLTLYALNDAKIDFIGSVGGIKSILNTPIDFDSYEVIADNRMRTYGWCYKVNGKSPKALTSDFMISSDSESVLEWYYGYAELINYDWISYCVPVYKNPTKFACKN